MASAVISRNKYIPHPIYPRMLGYGITLAMHVTNAVHMTNSFKGEVMKDEAGRQFVENRLKLLTVWNVYIQIFYATLGLFCDILSLASEGKDSTLVKTLKSIRDPLFSCVVWPYGFAVSIVFWTVYSYDHSFVVLPSVAKSLTLTANHIVHTAVVPVVLWEIVFRPRTVPDSHVLNLVVMYAYAATYLAVLVSSYIETGAWVYPMLNLLNGTIYFYAFFVISAIIIQTIYMLQWSLTERIWGSSEEKKID